MARQKMVVEGVVAVKETRAAPAADTYLITSSNVFLNKEDAIAYLENEIQRVQIRALPGNAVTPEDVYGRMARARMLSDQLDLLRKMTTKNRQIIDMKKLDHTNYLPPSVRVPSDSTPTTISTIIESGSVMGLMNQVTDNATYEVDSDSDVDPEDEDDA
jgi:hypothetical protein